MLTIENNSNKKTNPCCYALFDELHRKEVMKETELVEMIDSLISNIEIAPVDIFTI